MLEAVSSRLEACCSVRSLRLVLPSAISRAPSWTSAETLLNSPTTCIMESSRSLVQIASAATGPLFPSVEMRRARLPAIASLTTVCVSRTADSSAWFMSTWAVMSVA